MQYALLIVYFLIACILLSRLKIVKSTGLPLKLVLALFSLKTIAGLLYGYIYSRQPGFEQFSDTWQVYFDSLPEYRQLMHDPVYFFTHWFANPDHLSYTNFFGSTDSYWNDLKDKMLHKMQAVMNVFTFGYYYVNVVVYEFITFPGSLLLYNLLKRIFPESKKWHVIPVFLLPSFVFWTGGMYKDGFVFLFMMVVVWQFFQLLNKNDRKGTRILYLAVAFAGIFLLRNYIALLLLPSLLCWGLNMRWPRHAAWTFVIIYLIGSVAILFGSQLHAGLDFPSFIAERQQAFLALPANTKLPVPAIEPTAVGMIRYLPIAMRIGFAEPVLWDLPGLRYLVFSIELLFLLFLAALALYKRPQLTVNQHSYLFFALFFTASVWLCLGYMAPITGAIVRYRVICLPILASALMCTALIRQNK